MTPDNSMDHIIDNIVSGLRATPYVFDRYHGLMSADSWRQDGPNIGRYGANLTISFLSLNRSALSINLLASIDKHLDDFAGEVLIVDNGSHPDELAKMHQAAEQARVKCRVLELGANYGVAGGRNRTIPHVHTEWVLSLDNDIYFISNPLYFIQRDLALLGCHFLNLPLLDSDGKTLFAGGGHLYTWASGGDLSIGGGSVLRQQKTIETSPGIPFLSTFMFGGASVFKVDTFLKLGGFDESMFIGFEDTDFSIRLFQMGYKIGNTQSQALIHDHPLPTAETDRDYERSRFSRETLKKSADYLAAKHGIVVWNACVDEWLVRRQKELGVGEESTQNLAPPAPAAEVPPAIQVTPAKPRIALLVDSEGWAFWNISQQICRNLGSTYDLRVIPVDKIDHVVQTFLMVRDCDIVHVFWREYLGLLLTPHCQNYLRWLDSDYQRFHERILRPRVISTCVYDHLHADPQGLADRLPVYRDLANIYYVGSRKLFDIYAQADGYPKPAMVIEDGVDPRLFYPNNLERLDSIIQREILIGWTGNSNWGGQAEDYKGVRTILKPAVEQLRAEGLPVRLHLADRADSPPIPHDLMVNYYNSIDVYVCTSLIEGTPNPVLESMACGVPVISTDVGIVAQAFGPRQHEFILAERSVECLKDALRRLVAEPRLFRTLSNENIERISDWNWTVQTRKFDRYFQQCLALPKGTSSAPSHAVPCG